MTILESLKRIPKPKFTGPVKADLSLKLKAIWCASYAAMGVAGAVDGTVTAVTLGTVYTEFRPWLAHEVARYRMIKVISELKRGE